MTCQRSRGFSLLEVMVAIVILSLGMLGVAAVLITVHKANASSYLRQQAVQETYDILDRMRANRSAALQGGYDVALNTAPGTASVNCTSGSCSPTQLAGYDQWQWLTELASTLPSGTGSVGLGTVAGGTCGSLTYSNSLSTPPTAPVCVVVTVQWSDTPAQKMLKQAVAPATYTLQTVL
ncbi:MAG: type IV pilus modification protein PilV [Xanthomonadaceae bacterium]|nr:type IV pilus modification protein PilV [Xanthomonadaceae bacterium]MDE1959020.1 type IV pilus modification protein PilV [Xanthomonadaceae bacterium]MDE2177506.1 type IV pilus modification protein PilV [Xanthomonadaceae bacterium]MDE2244641.1 type IV pilus modification protein PilV [Xanthomonadaceae bacterium]